MDNIDETCCEIESRLCAIHTVHRRKGNDLDGDLGDDDANCARSQESRNSIGKVLN